VIERASGRRFAGLPLRQRSLTRTHRRKAVCKERERLPIFEAKRAVRAVSAGAVATAAQACYVDVWPPFGLYLGVAGYVFD
jgi:hypothetical protein